MTPAAPLKIAFVGLGFGAAVADALMSGPDRGLFTLAAVCDLDGAKVAAASARYGVKGYQSLEEVLAAADIAAVALFSGPVGRAALLDRIIGAGKDVMTTKPFELDPQAARQVLTRAEVLGRTLHVNSPSAEAPAYLEQIRRWAHEFDLGRPVSCRGEMLASYRETCDGRWLDDPALCPVAPIFRIGIYPLNDLVHLFGPVRAVQVLASRLFTGRPTADSAQLGLRFENDAIGCIQANFCVDNGQSYANTLTLNYERGTIHRNLVPVARGRAEWSSRLSLVATQAGGTQIQREWESAETPGRYPWAAFHQAITGRRVVRVPVDEIVESVEIFAAMARAERSGMTEPVRSGKKDLEPAAPRLATPA